MSGVKDIIHDDRGDSFRYRTDQPKVNADAFGLHVIAFGLVKGQVVLSSQDIRCPYTGEESNLFAELSGIICPSFMPRYGNEYTEPACSESLDGTDHHTGCNMDTVLVPTFHPMSQTPYFPVVCYGCKEVYLIFTL
jgi:hypothetical protein